ncbi:hypothetical protein [Desmonostoc muscorum]|nr:hypothetical protein [Desmonostoc muscorum]
MAATQIFQLNGQFVTLRTLILYAASYGSPEQLTVCKSSILRTI